MGKYPNKQHIAVAASNNHDFDLTKQIVTTHDFGTMKPIECRYMVPGDHFNYKISNFTRLLPMPSPTFGRITLKIRGFFVPIRSCWKYFNDFVTSRPSPTITQNLTSLMTNSCPTATMGQFATIFKGNFASKVSDSKPQLRSAWDFKASDGYYAFNRLGRKMFDFFKSLGLNLSFDTKYASVKVNLLPIIAFWKAYFDNIVPSRFLNDYPSYIQGLINALTYNADGSLSDAQLKLYFFNLPFSFYEDDYFIASHLKPFQDELQYNDNLVISNPDSDVTSSVHLFDDGNGTYVDGASNYVENFNYYTIQSLRQLQDYLNRGLLAGSKIQDWLLTEFGLRPSSDALQLSTYLGKMESVIKINDVMANADTASQGGVALGAYAGRATADCVSHFEYKAKEHGYFIITSELIPTTNYYQGLTPEFSMTKPFDFFQPEFDNLGVQAISYKELFSGVQKDAVDNQKLNPDSIFGFAPRYANLKTSFDIVSGDFGNRLGENLRSWYLGRDVENLLYNYPNISLPFCQMNEDLQNWEQMFNDASDETDHFYQIFLLENHASRPMLSIAEAFKPEHPNGTKDVTLKVNGGVD